VIRAIRLLGLEFADLDVEAAADWLARRPATAPFGYVTTPNADHLVRLNRRPGFAPLYRDALMCLLDSRVVAGVARLAGLRVPRVATGSDLTELLLTRHVAVGDRITIVGLRSEWLPALVARCGIAPPAHYDPPMGFADEASLLRAAVGFVLTHPARFVFLAVGSPQQEILAGAIARTRRATGVGLCIGASLEFVAGAARRAPLWVQHAGLEWLYRLCGNPRRLARRYLHDCPLVFPMLLRERLRLSRQVAVSGVHGPGRSGGASPTSLG
jgi:N-acetylglucosaminyldiphosphoundecaprenol N-acetyl-beta-D-mannosaminyltransferase